MSTGGRAPTASCAPACSPWPPSPTLADLPTLLAVPAFRQRALDAVDDPVLAGFWAWYDSLSEAARGQATAPLMN